MTTYNPPHPTANDEIKRKALEKLVGKNRDSLPDDIDDEDLIEHLMKHAHVHLNAYQIAKALDEQECWYVDADTVAALDDFYYYLGAELKNAEIEWIEKNNIQPPFPVGTQVEYLHGTLKIGEITEICAYVPGCYLIKEAGQDDEKCHKKRAVVRWECVKEIQK